jgi:hypothetical protein
VIGKPSAPFLLLSHKWPQREHMYTFTLISISGDNVLDITFTLTGIKKILSGILSAKKMRKLIEIDYRRKMSGNQSIIIKIGLFDLLIMPGMVSWG